MRRILAFISAVLLGSTLGQSLPMLARNGADITLTVPNGTASRSMRDRAGIDLTVEDFGAKGDCSADSTRAFNAYAAHLRSRNGYGQYRQFTLGADRCYKLTGSVNLTALDNTIIDGRGSRLIGTVNGRAVLDALQSTNIVFRDFKLISGGAPLHGIQVGRALNPLSGAGGVSIYNVMLDGEFTRSAFYNRGAEVSNFFNPKFYNRYNSADAYALIMDGSATWQIISDYASTYNSSNPTVVDALYPYTAISFNENAVFSGTLSSFRGPAVWMSNFRGHTYWDTYIAAYGPGPAAIVHFSTGDDPKHLTWKVHSEASPVAASSLTSDIRFSGSISNPRLVGLDYTNHIEMTAGSVFSRGGSVGAVTLNDADIRIPAWYNTNRTIFDDASSWTVDGRVFTANLGSFNANSFSGVLNVAGSVTYYGALAPSVALPSTIDVSAVRNSGSVYSITVSGFSQYRASIPVVSIAAPQAGGSQAIAEVSEVGVVGINSTGFSEGATGYTNDDVVELNIGCASRVAFKLRVSDGAVTGITTNGVIGRCPASVMTNAAIPTRGGTGTGLRIDGTKTDWRILTVIVTAGGGGYLSPPAVTFPTGVTGPSSTAHGRATLTSSLVLKAGSGHVHLNTYGTVLGIAGPAGAPVLSAGALIDNSAVRTALTGSYTVPANTSLVRFTQSSRVESALITLPSAIADGQALQFVNYEGLIAALSFAPVANGWTNGSPLAPYTGVRVRWDATAAAWYREQ